MKLYKKIIAVIILVILFSNLYRCYATSQYNINFNINNNEYEGNFKSQYKEIKLNNLAPGIKGDINIKISNSKKEVNYILEFFNEENKPFNMKFYYENKEYNSLADLNNFLSGSLKQNEEKNIEIKYSWNYETGKNVKEVDENDKKDMLDNNKTYKFCVQLMAKDLNDKISENKQNPKTGDDIITFIFLLIISIILLAITIKYKYFYNKNKLD